MFDFPNFGLFLITSLLINIMPGPDMLYTAARSLSQGSKAGVVSALGIFTGCLVHIVAAVLGLSALVANSMTLFTIFKMLGAFYLIYLGLKALSARTTGAEGEIGTLENTPLARVYWQGVVTNVLNPKVAVFFLSFLPQFVNPHSEHLQAQIAFLGLWFDIQGTLTLILVALLTGYFRELLNRSPVFWRWQNRVTGAILLWLGVRVAIYD